MRFPSYVIGQRVFEPCLGAVRQPDGTETSLRLKAAQVLLYLAGRGGQVVARETILEAVWPGIFVTDDSITQCIVEIRRALGPDGALLRTLARRGYMLDMRPAVPAAASKRRRPHRDVHAAFLPRAATRWPRSGATGPTPPPVVADGVAVPDQVLAHVAWWR